MSDIGNVITIVYMLLFVIAIMISGEVWFVKQTTYKAVFKRIGRKVIRKVVK